MLMRPRVEQIGGDREIETASCPVSLFGDAHPARYLDDRKARISIARVDDHLYAFDDICTCTDHGCPLSGGLLTGTTITCQCHGSRFDITPAP